MKRLICLAAITSVIYLANAQSTVEVTFNSERFTDATLVESFNLRDSGEFVNLYYRNYELCSFSDVMEYITKQAIEKGGNLVAIDEVMYPRNGANRLCYGIRGSILKRSNEVLKSDDNKKITSDVNKVRVTFYRPTNKFLRIHSVKVYNDTGELLFKIKDGEVRTIELERDKIYTFKTKKNSEKKTFLDLKNQGRNDIYIRAGIIAGVFGPDGDLYMSNQDLYKFEMD